MDTCFELYKLMRSRGLTPSQVTYGILLDGFINDNEAGPDVPMGSDARFMLLLYKPQDAHTQIVVMQSW